MPLPSSRSNSHKKTLVRADFGNCLNGKKFQSSFDSEFLDHSLRFRFEAIDITIVRWGSFPNFGIRKTAKSIHLEMIVKQPQGTNMSLPHDKSIFYSINLINLI